MKAADVKAQINERIIQALSEGKIPWLKPWTENGPRNLFSGRAYTGLNRLILGLSPYPLPFWATYRQYLAAGLQVQKGEHGHGIIYAGRTVKTDTKTDENGEETENKKQIRFLKAFVVFNIAQTDYQEKGYKLPDLKENPHLLGCDAVIQDYTGRHSIKITAGDRAAYLPQMDMYHLPGYQPVQNIRALLCDDVSRVHPFHRATARPVQADRSGLLRVRYLRTRGTGRRDRECIPGSAYRHRLISGCPESGSLSPELGNSDQGRCRSRDVCSRQGREGSGFYDRGFCPGPCQRHRNRCSGRGDGMTTIFDAMPVKVLEELERIETTISEKEQPGLPVLQADAQDLRLRHDEIIASWKARAEREGLDNLVAERQRLDAIAWIFDPLPSRIPSEY